MKEAIMQILKDNAWEMEKDRYVIGLSNIDNIAEEIIKLFLIPTVIKSICDNCGAKEPMIYQDCYATEVFRIDE